ncbi:hypothetical protein [Streptomyces niger]|uniref:hypothetical protein n=1 Tax=Streptomyces niger TaxID=66373 RepID=UPI000699B100|nr:hypothetical protein [Streptomyces niger]
MTTDFRVRRAEATDAPALARLRWEFKEEDRDDREAGSSAPTRSMARAEQWIRERGTDVLIVWPSERSVPVYRRAGFRPSTELLEAREP